MTFWFEGPWNLLDGIEKLAIQHFFDALIRKGGMKLLYPGSKGIHDNQ